MSTNKNSPEHHDHSNCGHEHHDHEHKHGHEHENCGHDHTHGDQMSHQRHLFSEKELQDLRAETMDNLMVQVESFLTNEEFGKAVPLFEVVLSKLETENLQDPESILDLINIKQNLAFSYGIIGEHANAVPLWKNVIVHKEQNVEDCTDLLDDYFGIALSCEQCEMDEDFLMYIQKGLKLARENQLEEYVASFEHELGGFYCDLSDFEKSENHLKNAIQIREKLEDIVGLAMSKMYMGILLEEQKKYPEAKQFYENALELTKNEDYSEELVEERAELELRLSKIQSSNLKDKLLNI